MKTRRTKSMLGVTGIVLFLCSCSVFEVLPGEPPKKKIVLKTSEETPPPKTISSKPPGTLGPVAKLRRMSLDVTNRLPSEADLQAVADDPAVYYQLVDAYLTTPEANEALAQMHLRMWDLAEDRLGQLDHFVATGDITTPLDSDLREKIVREPVRFLQYAFDRNLSLDEWFSQGYTVAHADVLALWSWNPDSDVYPSDGVSRSDFADNRPNIGLLGSQGFWASISDSYATHPRQKTAALMRKLACFSPSAAHAHRFYELTEESYSSPIIESAGGTSPCKNCHALFETPSATLGTIAEGNTFADWLGYEGEEITGSYSGHLFTGLTELSSFVANDPRFHRCEVTGVNETIFQRPKTSLDNTTLIRALDQLSKNDLDLKAAIAEIVKSQMYAYGKVTTKVKGSYVTAYSGVRFLSRRQWRGILSQLSRATSQLDPPAALEPGSDETLTDGDHAPTGSYWYATNQIARQAATAIVDQELADNYSVAARRVFKYLPDGSGAGATSTQVFSQLQYLWRLLIGPELASDSAEMAYLVNFWNEALDGRNTDEAARDAWRTILVGIFTHPNFVTY